MEVLGTKNHDQEFGSRFYIEVVLFMSQTCMPPYGSAFPSTIGHLGQSYEMVLIL